MAGTRTAPAFTAAANARQISLLLIDVSGDTFSVAMYVPVAALAGLIETWAAAYQAGTQSSLWAIEDRLIRSGDQDNTNAEAGSRDSVADGVNFLYKNATTRDSIDLRLVAPDPTTMEDDLDIPDLASDAISDLTLATIALNAGYTLETAQYTERQERKNNTKIRA